MTWKRRIPKATGRAVAVAVLAAALVAPAGVASAQHSGITNWNVFNWEFQGDQLLSNYGNVTSSPSERYRVDSFLQKRQAVIWDYTGAWFRVDSGAATVDWDYDSWADDGDAHFFPDGNARYRVIDELDIFYHGVWIFLEDVISPDIVCDASEECDWD